MTDTNQKQEDEVLRRMLATLPTPHKPKGQGDGDKRKAGRGAGKR